MLFIRGVGGGAIELEGLGTEEMGWRGDWCPLKRGYTGACREEKQPSLGIDPSRWRHWASPVTVGASPQRHCPPPWGWVSAGLDEGIGCMSWGDRSCGEEKRKSI